MPPSIDDTRPQKMNPEPDPHGRAALLLAESTLHALVELSALSAAEAVSVVQSAAEVDGATAEADGATSPRPVSSAELLARIRASFEVDLRAKEGLRPAAEP